MALNGRRWMRYKQVLYVTKLAGTRPPIAHRNPEWRCSTGKHAALLRVLLLALRLGLLPLA
jgi:hypothetical protein